MKTYKFSSLILVTVFLIPMAFASSSFIVTAYTRTSSVFIYGTGAGPVDLDPADAWDSVSAETILQVCEGLYSYNMSDPNLPIIPWLASAMPTIYNNGTSYNVPLRGNITFQDGYAFNATSCKWSFDRLFNGFINTGMSQFFSLYAAIGREPVVNNTVAYTDNNSITFNLNYVYAPFLALLCFSGSLVVAPTISHFNPFYQANLLNIGNSSDVLLGTGPFLYKGYVADDHVTFQTNPDYWGGPLYQQPSIQTLIYQIYPDSNDRNNALLDGDIQMIDAPNPDYFTQFNESSKIDLVTGPLSSTIQYIGMNVKKIPQAVRQAANYAFDYSYALTKIYNGTASRMTSPIPVGIMYHLNISNIPKYNITKARQILVNAGLTAGRSDSAALANVSDNDAWINASDYHPLYSYFYSYNADNSVRLKLGQLLQPNLARIGIVLKFAAITWMNYSIPGALSLNNMQFYCSDLVPDYNDPSDYINSLFTLPGGVDWFQLNDTNVNGNITLGMESLNSTVRQQCYYNIQKDIALNLMPWIMVAQDKTYGAWLQDVTGVHMNVMGYIYFGSVSYTPSSSIAGYNIGLTLLSILAGIGVIAIVVKKRRTQN